MSHFTDAEAQEIAAIVSKFISEEMKLSEYLNEQLDVYDGEYYELRNKLLDCFSESEIIDPFEMVKPHLAEMVKREIGAKEVTVIWDDSTEKPTE